MLQDKENPGKVIDEDIKVLPIVKTKNWFVYGA